MLLHSSCHVRAAASALIVTSNSQSVPFHERTLESLSHLLLPALSDVETWARYELLSIFKKLCTRLMFVVTHSRKTMRAGVDELAPDESPLGKPGRTRAELAKLESTHVQFVIDFLDCLMLELGPSSSYQRHIMALMCLETAISCGLAQEVHPRLFTTYHAATFCDLLMDGYGDVRSAASRILISFPKDCPLEPSYPLPADDQSENVVFRKRAENLAKDTGRASIAEGLGLWNEVSMVRSYACREPVETRTARLDKLLKSMSKDVTAALYKPVRVPASAPLHARFISLRLLLCKPEFVQMCYGLEDGSKDKMQGLYRRINSDCCRTWDAVKHVLCVDSPEGHQEEAQELDGDPPDVGPKDTLSYCWRSLKESSALLATALAQDGHYTGLDGRIESPDHAKFMGEFCLYQLKYLRHRGAFSTVASTFRECCSLCVHTTNEPTSKAPLKWFEKDVKSCIIDEAKSSTRRSGGIPAMATGILEALPPGPDFDATIKWLQETARSSTAGRNEVPQVHALNCLKDVVYNSRLAEKTETYLEEMLEISVTCLFHDVWAIRNCGVMLFKALLTRLLKGSSLNEDDGIESRRRFAAAVQRRYPKLIEIAVRLLRASATDDADDEDSDDTARRIQTAFPALEIIEAIGIPESHRVAVEGLLFRQLGNRSWHIRDKAARALSLITSPSAFLSRVEEATRTSTWSQNLEHGTLLSLKHLCQACGLQGPDLDCILACLDLLCSRRFLHRCCIYTQAARWDVCSALLEYNAYNREPSADSDLMEALKRIFRMLEQVRLHGQIAWNAMTCAKIKLACLEASLTNNCKPIYIPVSEVLQRHRSTNRSSFQAALEAVRKIPQIGGSKELFSFIELVSELIGSSSADLAATAARLLVELLSNSRHDLIGSDFNSGGFPPDFFNVIGRLTQRPFMLGFKDPGSYHSALRLRGSMVSILYYHSQVRVSRDSNIDTLIEQWAKMLQQALDPRSVSSVLLRCLQCYMSETI